MKSKEIIDKPKKTDSQKVKKSSHLKGSMVKSTEINPVYAEMVKEHSEDFYNYLDWLGLARSQDLIILASSHHYYFEVDDLRNVKSVVNLKNLNNIVRLKEFLQELYNVLPHKCYFIGRFTDSRRQNLFIPSRKSTSWNDTNGTNQEAETGRWNSFLNVLYGVIDAKTNRYLTEKSVRQLLMETGLKIHDITEFNGLTYFCTQKDNPSVE